MCLHSNDMESDAARRIPQILSEHAVQWRCNGVYAICYSMLPRVITLYE